MLNALALTAGVIASAGCSSQTYLMPTPNIYADDRWNPFDAVPPALQGNEVSVMYLTDRSPEIDAPEQQSYGFNRSRSLAFGEATVTLGEDMTWPEVVTASRAPKRAQKIPLDLAAVRELGRFGKTPPDLVITDAQMASGTGPEPDPAQLEAEARFRSELAARLAKTRRKEVFIYVHGFANTFEDAALTTAELWHFLGREGVPICYTWPAGVGLFKAYEYTLSSTQFTVYHFKQALRLIASCPEVEKVHILAHSRGTAVTTETVRELHLEIRGTADTQKTLKLGTVVLAAADIDLDVAIARNATERVGRAAERVALYISREDGALGLSSWLFGGSGRVGNIDVTIFSPAELEILRKSEHLQLIDARIRKQGIGHSYFHDNPAVSSDVVLLMRYGLPPGAEHGRPLDVTELGLWSIGDAFPGPSWSPEFLEGKP